MDVIIIYIILMDSGREKKLEREKGSEKFRWASQSHRIASPLTTVTNIIYYINPIMFQTFKKKIKVKNMTIIAFCLPHNCDFLGFVFFFSIISSLYIYIFYFMFRKNKFKF